MNKKFISSFDIKNNDEYISVIKQFFKASIKLERILIIINEDYLDDKSPSEIHIKVLKNLDKKILISTFYINAIIKLFLYDFRYIITKYLRE